MAEGPGAATLELLAIIVRGLSPSLAQRLQQRARGGRGGWWIEVHDRGPLHGEPDEPAVVYYEGDWRPS